MHHTPRPGSGCNSQVPAELGPGSALFAAFAFVGQRWGDACRWAVVSSSRASHFLLVTQTMLGGAHHRRGPKGRGCAIRCVCVQGAPQEKTELGSFNLNLGGAAVRMATAGKSGRAAHGGGFNFGWRAFFGPLGVLGVLGARAWAWWRARETDIHFWVRAGTVAASQAQPRPRQTMSLPGRLRCPAMASPAL
jgi:hypothetical protein